MTPRHFESSAFIELNGEMSEWWSPLGKRIGLRRRSRLTIAEDVVLLFKRTIDRGAPRTDSTWRRVEGGQEGESQWRPT